jgi:hypothetical protein
MLNESESGWAADSCPWVGKLRTALPLSDVIRDSAVQLVLTSTWCKGCLLATPKGWQEELPQGSWVHLTGRNTRLGMWTRPAQTPLLAREARRGGVPPILRRTLCMPVASGNGCIPPPQYPISIIPTLVHVPPLTPLTSCSIALRTHAGAGRGGRDRDARSPSSPACERLSRSRTLFGVNPK